MFHKNTPIDDQLFVDFNLLSGAKEFDGEGAASRFNDYMIFNINRYKTGNKSEVINNFTNFSESSYFPKLGYGKTESGYGKGTAVESFITVLNILDQKNMLETLTQGNIYAAVFVKDYGPDRSSDTLIKLITPELSDYTKKVAKIYGFPTKVESVDCWNVDSHQWESKKIVLANTKGTTDVGDYLLICPEEILTSRLTYSMRNFIFSYWREIMNASLEKKDERGFTYNELVNFVNTNYASNYAYMLMVLSEIGSYVKNPDIKVRTNLTFNLNYLI